MFDNKIFDNSGGGGALTPGTTPVVGGVEHAILYIDSAIIQGSANLTFDGSTFAATNTQMRNTYSWTDYSWGTQPRTLLTNTLVFSSLTNNPSSITLMGVNSGFSVTSTNRKGQIGVTCFNAQLQDDVLAPDETWYCYGWFRVSGTANVSNGETFTIGTRVYTFVNTLTNPDDVKIGANLTASIFNAGAAINGTGTVGVEHNCATAHADVQCTLANTSYIVLQTRVAGSAGEAIALVETSARLSRSNPTMLRRAQQQYSQIWGYKADITLNDAMASIINGAQFSINLQPTHTGDISVMYGVIAEISAQSPSAAPRRGTMVGAKIGCYNSGGYAANMHGILCEVALNNDGATSFGTCTSSVYGIKIDNLTTVVPLAGTVTGDVVGLHIADFSGLGGGRNYGIRQLGYSINYFEGPPTFLSLQTGGVVTATAGTGALGLVTDAAGVLTSDGSGNLSFAAPAAPALTSPLALDLTANDAAGFIVNITKSRGAAGVDGDQLGKINFYGYNDGANNGAVPQVCKYAYIEAGIAASGAADDLERGYLAFWAKANYDSTEGQPVFKIHQNLNYFISYDFQGALGGSGNKGPAVRLLAPTNAGSYFCIDTNGGDGQMSWTSSGGATEWWKYYLRSADANLVFYNTNNVTPAGIIQAFYTGSGIIGLWTDGVLANAPASMVKGLLIGNAGVAPSAVPTNAVAMWCADYAAGDARLYIMGEASTDKTVIGSGVIELQALQADANGPSLVFLKNRGAAGQDADVLGKISFKGYNDNATPELTEFAYIAGIMHDASDTTEDGGIALYATLAGTSRKVYQTDQYAGYLAHHFYGCNWGGAWTPIGNSTATMIIDAYYTNALYMNCSVDNRIEFYTNAGASANGMLYCNYQATYLVNYGTQIGGVPDASIGLWGGTGCIQLNAPLPYSYYINDASARSVLGWHSNSPVAPTTVSADVVQMWVADYAAADARLYLMGEKNTNKIALGAGGMLLDSSLADDSYSGVTITGTAGEDLAFGDVCYRKSDGKYWKADANAAATMPGVVLCLQAIDESVSATGEFLKYGFIRDDSWTAWTVGGLLYVSAAAVGAMVQTAPSGSGDQVQVLGYAYSAKVVFFNPQYVMVEV